MGRPKGSKNKSKAEVAEDVSPGEGHNSRPPLTEDQQQTLFFSHVRAYVAALEVKKKADADFKNACKLAKSEGTALFDIKTHLELQTDEGEAKVRARLEAALRIARWNGLPLGKQTDLFAGTDRTPSVDIAYDDGKRDGLQAKGFGPKYQPGTAQYNRYCDGYGDGQAVNLSGIKQGPVVTDDGDAEFDGDGRAFAHPDPLDGADAPGTHSAH